jgi:hypothetical protein
MLVLLWFVIMLLPTVLSTEAPHYLRSAGALPPLAILYAFGAEAVITLRRRVRNRSAHTDPGAPSDVAAVLGVLLLLLLWSGTTTARDYFQRWARLPGLGTAFDVTKQLAAETAAQLLMEPASDEALLMASELYLQPQMGFALGPVAAGVAPSVLQQETAPIRMVVEDGFDQQASLMLVSLDGARPISTWLQPLGSEQLAATTPARTRRAQAHQPGWPQTTEVNLPPGAPLQMRQIRYPLDVTFANGLRLVGYDVEPDVLQPGQERARLTLFWQDDASSRLRPNAQEGEWRSDFDVFVNLNVAGAVEATANGQLRGQALAERLHAGQPVVEDVRVLAAPEASSAGKAHFEVGLYRYRPGNDPGFNERIAIIDQTGQAVADQVDLGALWIGAGPKPGGVPDPGALEVQFDDGIQLMGVSTAEDPGNPQRLWAELAWQALDRASTGYTAFVHLLDSADQIVAQYDAPPGGAGNPTNLWAPGEIVRSTFPLDLTAQQKRAGVRLRVGLYEPVSGRQLPITAAGDPAVDISGGSYVLIDIQ